MKRSTFEGGLLLLGAGFAVFFFVYVLPPAWQSGDLVGVFAAGFVNPFAAGYSTDVIVCALILWLWVFYEAALFGVRHGWIVIPLSLFPGVAVALAVYLVLRSRQQHGYFA